MTKAAQAHWTARRPAVSVGKQRLPLKIIRLAGMAVMAMALIAACGGSSPTTAPLTTPGPVASTPVTATPTAAPAGPTNPPIGGTVDVCSLLTAAELNAATGRSDYAAGSLNSVDQCLWNIEGASTNTGSLIIGYFQADDLNFIKSLFGEGGVDLTVGGHAAFYNPIEGLGSLWVDVGGGQIFILSFPRSGDLEPSAQAIMVQLAELALGRM